MEQQPVASLQTIMEQALQSAIATEERHIQELAEEKARVAADMTQAMKAAFQARLASLIESHQQEIAASQLAHDEKLSQMDMQHSCEVKAIQDPHGMTSSIGTPPKMDTSQMDQDDCLSGQARPTGIR